MDECFFVEDLNSKFGTYVNNHQITNLTTIRPNDRISIGYHKIRLADLLDTNGSNSVNWKDLLIPGRHIDKHSFRTLIIVLLCYPIIVGFGVPTILTLINVSLRQTNLKIELDVWELSPNFYWVFGLVGLYISVIIILNFKNEHRVIYRDLSGKD